MNEILIVALSIALLATTISLAIVLRRYRLLERGVVLPSTPEEGGSSTAPADAPDVDESRAREIVERMSEGVLVLDGALRPVFSNSPARTMLGIRDNSPTRVPSEEILELARRVLRYGNEIVEVINLWFPYRSRIKVRIIPLIDGTGTLVLLRDVTEEMLAQQIRTEFVAHASHELKSPVASLQALSEAVSEAVRDDPDAAVRFSEKLAVEAGRLGRLIADLMDLSRLEDPARMPDEPIDLSEVARRELDQIQPAARAKSMRLHDQIGSDVWVKGDDEQLALMIRNLLENAVRYTPDGGSVTLGVTRSDEHAVVRVTDTGIGISQEAQARVFERFYRVDRARSRDRGGTGLGLAIVKHVAELHGGGVRLESELGRGSVFIVEIPAIPVPRTRLRPAAG